MLRTFARGLFRNPLLILSCLTVALGAAYLVTEQMTSQYASSVRVLVSGSADSADSAEGGALDESITETRTSTYAVVVTSQVLATRVADRLLGNPDYRGDAGLKGAKLQEQVEAKGVPGTAIVEIRVTDTDPALAQLVAQTYAEELIVTAAEIEAGDLSLGLSDGNDVEDADFTVVDFASFDNRPVFPRPVQVLLLAGGAGLLLGMLLAGLREAFVSTLRTEKEVAALVGAPVLASIAHEPSRGSQLVTDLDHQSSRVEGFAVLRTGVQFADPGAGHKVVVVTSAVAGEGKSSTAVNLALTLARAGVRTLLVDGDLRRPQVASTFDIDGSAGVTTVLLGKVALEDAVWTQPDTGLAVLPSGVVPPNPSELLQTTAMGNLLERLRGDYEVVVVDGAPLNPVTDASLLAARADGVLLVVRHARSTRRQVHTAVERLAQVGATTIGVALNDVPRRRGSAATYGGYERDDQQAAWRGPRRTKA